MGTLVRALHETEPGKLAAVVDQMRLLGAPTIRCCRIEDGLLVAVEGTHRLAAAALLGLTPILEEVSAIPEESDLDGGAYAGKSIDGAAYDYLCMAAQRGGGATYEVRL